MNERNRLREAQAARPCTRGVRQRCSLALLVICGGLLLAAGRTPAGAQDVDGARALLEQWVQARKVISQEKRAWALGQELLVDRIDVVRREIDSLRARIAEAETKIAAADTQRDELVRAGADLVQASQAMGTRVLGFEQRTRELLVRLPEPIREAVRPLSQQLPSDPEATTLSLSQRFQNVIGILNLVNKFNGKVTTASEVRTLADGTTAEVAALYIGIGQGFYVNGTATAAGVGRSTETGWAWTPADEHATAIERAIAIHHNEASAAFVQLPVRLE